jgi:hypothetical protein
MGRMAVVNRAVHGELYTRILREQAAALADRAAAGPTSSDADGSGPPPDAPISPTVVRPGRPARGARPAGSDECDRPLVRRRIAAVDAVRDSCG